MQKMRSQGVWRVLGRTLKKLRMMAQGKGKERRPEGMGRSRGGPLVTGCAKGCD